ncbi:MAG: ATP-binding protein [Deltaproteobacteria bacterium]|nr:ATP-binding protein [Deltaproteobacteria bacterium]
MIKINRLAIKYILLLLVFMLIILSSVGSFSYLFLRDRLEENNREVLVLTSRSIVNLVAVYIENKTTIFEEIANIRAIDDYNKNLYSNLLKRSLKDFQEEFISISLIGKNGKERLKVVNSRVEDLVSDKMQDLMSSKLQNYSRQEYFKKVVLEPNKVHIDKPKYSADLHQSYLDFYYHSQKDSGESLGILKMSISLSEIEKLAYLLPASKSRFVLMLDHDRYVVMAPDSRSIGSHIEKDNLAEPRLIEKLRNKELIFGEYLLLGKQSYISLVTLGKIEWKLIVAIPFEQYNQPLKNLIDLFLIIGIVIIAVGCLLSIFYGYLIAKPILKLTQFTTEITQSGDLSKRVESISRDEIGDLALSFNEMLEKLQRAEIEIRSSQIYIFNILQNISNSLIVISSEGHIKIVNKATIEMLQYSEDEIIGMPVSKILKESEDYGSFTNASALKQTNLPKTSEHNYITKSGKEVPVLFSFSFLENDSDHSQSIILIGQDITDQKIATEQLRRHQEDLEIMIQERTKALQDSFGKLEAQHIQLKETQSQLVQSEKMAGLGTLVAGVAHEINNPVNFVNVSSKTLVTDLKEFKELIFDLADDADDDFVKLFNEKFDHFDSCLKDITEGISRIKTIVLDLRTFSRLDESEQKKVLISDSLLTTLRLVKAQYNKEVNFICDFKVEKEIECWPAQLNQVFMNIMSNACQAIIFKQEQKNELTPGDLTISTFVKDDKLGIAFKDTGCGMNDIVINKIFEPFFTTKTVGEGTGLGMSISYGIIEKHNGNIQVSSIPDQGTTITLLLPYN